MLSHSESPSRLLLGVCLADELHHSGVGQCGGGGRSFQEARVLVEQAGAGD